MPRFPMSGKPTRPAAVTLNFQLSTLLLAFAFSLLCLAASPSHAVLVRVDNGDQGQEAEL